MKSPDSVSPFVKQNILSSLTTILLKRNLASRHLASQILADISQNEEIVIQMRKGQTETSIAEFLHTKKRKKTDEGESSLEVEAKTNCIITAANIFSRHDETMNKVYYFFPLCKYHSFKDELCSSKRFRSIILACDRKELNGKASIYNDVSS